MVHPVPPVCERKEPLAIPPSLLFPHDVFRAALFLANFVKSRVRANIVKARVRANIVTTRVRTNIAKTGAHANIVRTRVR